MTTMTLNKWGHSYGIRIPQVLLKQLEIAPGDLLELETDLEAQRLILKPAVKRKGWLEAFNKKESQKKVEPLMEFTNRFDEGEWTW